MSTLRRAAADPRSRAVPALLAALVLAAPSASAEETDDPNPRLEVARRVVRLVTPKEAWRSSMEQMSSQMLASQAETLPPGFLDKMMKVLEEVMPYAETVEWAASIYAERFTLAELRDLERFYRTQVGRKLAKELPGIMGEVGRRTGALIRERLPAALERHGLAP